MSDPMDAVTLIRLKSIRSSLNENRLMELCMSMENLQADARSPEVVQIAGDAFIAIAETLKIRQAIDSALSGEEGA